MYPRLSFVVGLAGAAAAAVAACGGGAAMGPDAGGSGAGHATGASGTGVGGALVNDGGTMASTSGTGAMGPCNMDPSVDGDADGWTPAEGDCDD